MLKREQIAFLLSNPFYVGRFRYGGEMYDGAHAPIITRELFDRVQKVLKARSNANRPPENNPQAYCGLLACGECGCSITAEVKTKTQQNGNTHRYVYYHCTKKRGKCDGAYLSETALDAELSDLLSRFHLPSHWAAELEKMAEKDAADAAHTAAASVSALRADITALDAKIARLTDLYVAQDIERDEYHSCKREHMSAKRTAQENILRLEQDATHWLEPMQKWISEAQTMEKIAQSEDLPLKISSLQKIFGSNLALHAREARGTAKMHWLSLPPTKESQYQNASVQELVPMMVM